jgi:hypothetical protein
MGKKIFYLVVLIIVILLGICFGKIRVLVVEEATTNKIIYQQRIESEVNFAIKYTHSVENTPVWDYFKISGEEILLTSTRYKSYGAGLPFLNKNKYTVANEQFLIEDINIKLDQIPLRVSNYAKHKLLIEEDIYKLYQLTSNQNLLLFKVEKKSRYQFILWEVRQWLSKKS